MKYREFTAGLASPFCRHPRDPKRRPHRIYNLGNHRPVPLMRFIETIEKACGRKAKIDLQPMQPGDVQRTCSDIELSTRELGKESDRWRSPYLSANALTSGPIWL